MTLETENRIDTFNYTRCPSVPTISALAHRLGFVEQELRDEPDLQARYQSVGFTPKLQYAHDDRLWLRNAGHGPAVWARSEGVDSRVVALAWLEGSYPVYASRRAAAHVADLRGLRLGVVRVRDLPFDLLWAQQLKIYAATLSTVGLTLDDVRIVEIWRDKPSASTRERSTGSLFGGDVAAEALRRGDIDAIAVRLDEAEVRALDLVEIYDTRKHPDPLARVHPSVLRGIVVSADLIRERRDVLVRVLARLLEAGEWALDHPLQARDEVAADLHQAPETLTLNFGDIAAGVQIDLNPSLVAALRVQKDFLLQHRLIRHDFDIDAWVDPAPLHEARQLLERRKREGGSE